MLCDLPECGGRWRPGYSKERTALRPRMDKKAFAQGRHRFSRPTAPLSAGLTRSLTWSGGRTTSGVDSEVPVGGVLAGEPYTPGALTNILAPAHDCCGCALDPAARRPPLVRRGAASSGCPTGGDREVAGPRRCVDHREDLRPQPGRCDYGAPGQTLGAVVTSGGA